jgi:PPOX class probable F420-dependent enzyme
MEPAAVDAFLRAHHTMALATVGPGGFPHVVPMSYGWLDGDLAFWAESKSQKVVNLRRDPRLGCLVEDGEDYESFRGVHLAGRAQFVTDPGELSRLAREILTARFGSADESMLPAPLDRLVARRTGVRVQVLRTASWDHTRH